MSFRPNTVARLICAGALLSIVVPAALAIEAPVEMFTPLTPEESQVAVLPAGSAAAAVDLSAVAECHLTKRRAALVGLRWSPVAAGQDGALPEGSAQRVEITKFREGFSTGRLEATRRLESAVETVAVDSAETGIYYYWRVLTLTAEGWVPSQVGRFEVPVCPYDPPDLSRFEGALNDDGRPAAGQNEEGN